MNSFIVPKIGEVKSSKELGKPYTKPIIWLRCPKCEKCRWVQVQTTKEESFTGLCDKCYKQSRLGSRRVGLRYNGSKHGRWKSKAGYIFVRVYEDDFFYPMAGNNGYISEHRLVVARALGRNLHRWEIVHHKHTKYPAGSIEDKQDNRYPENLQLVTDERHRQITILEERIKYLEKLLSLANIPFNHRYIQQ